MQMEPILQNGWSLQQRQTSLEVCFLQFHFCFFVKMSIADCLTCLCSLHSFLGAGNYREADSKQSSVKCREGLGKKPSLFTLDQHYQSHRKNEQSEREKKKYSAHVSTQSSIASVYNSSPRCLILIAICLESQVPVPHSCFQSERN